MSAISSATSVVEARAGLVEYWPKARYMLLAADIELIGAIAGTDRTTRYVLEGALVTRCVTVMSEVRAAGRLACWAEFAPRRRSR